MQPGFRADDLSAARQQADTPWGARLGGRPALALARLAGPRGFAGDIAPGRTSGRRGMGVRAGAARRRGFANYRSRN